MRFLFRSPCPRRPWLVRRYRERQSLALVVCWASNNQERSELPLNRDNQNCWLSKRCQKDLDASRPFRASDVGKLKAMAERSSTGSEPNGSQPDEVSGRFLRSSGAARNPSVRIASTSSMARGSAQ